MTPNNNRDPQEDLHENMHEQPDPNVRQHAEGIDQETGKSSEPEPDLQAGRPQKRSLVDHLRTTYTQAATGRKTKSTDRSKGLMALAISAFVVVFVVIAMLSHSTDKASETKRTKPSLGRPEAPPSTAQEKRGLSDAIAERGSSNQENNGSDEISPDDVHNTGRTRLPTGSAANGNERIDKTLASVPQMDPALEATARRRALLSSLRNLRHRRRAQPQRRPQFQFRQPSSRRSCLSGITK